MNAEERKQAAARALPLVDLTDLTDTCNHEAIDRLCDRAQTRFGNTGAICIWPRFVAHAKSRLRGKKLPIATVVNFPAGDASVEMTVLETRAALDDGADEIDLVHPYRAFSSGDETASRAMIEAVKAETEGRGLLKVILETGELTDDQAVRRASELAIEAGADFIKTSTGKVPVNATPQVAEIMIQAIADSGKDVGFKPAGGVKTVEDTASYLAIADRIMGPDWVSPKTFRFGASGVLDDLLAALEGGAAETSVGY